MLYVLAYRVKDEKNWYGKITHDENNPKTKRDLLLYRLDGAEWIESSTVVQTDYELIGVEQDYGTHKSYGVVEYSRLLNKSLSLGQVRLLSNGCVVVLLTNEYITPESKGVNFNYNAIAILVPNGNGT